MDCNPPGSSIHGISQARILEWVVISFFRGSFRLRDRICVSCVGRWIVYHWATREALHWDDVASKCQFGKNWWQSSDQWKVCVSLVSVQFSHSVMFNSLRPHELQHARSPCPSPTPGVHSDSRTSSRWCHPAISSSVIPFSFCPQSLPGSGTFPKSQLFAWGGQSIGVSASASVFAMNTQE